MKRFLLILSSTRLMAVLLLVFALAIASSTFIENDFGTAAARKLVYNARWFEFLFFLGSANIIAVIIRNKMYKKGKWTLFIFHIAFLIIIIGAGVTRYFGSEGSMHIREGEAADNWISSQNYLEIRMIDHHTVYSKIYPVLLSPVLKKNFRKVIKHAGHKIKINAEEYLPYAEKVLADDPDGLPLVNIVAGSDKVRSETFLTTGQSIQVGQTDLTFVTHPDTLSADSVIRIFIRNGLLHFYSPIPVSRVSMDGKNQMILVENQIHPLIPSMLHYLQGTPVIVKQYTLSGRIDARSADARSDNYEEAVRLSIMCDNIEKTAVVFGSRDQNKQFTPLEMNGVELVLNYGPLMSKLPFRLRLNDFILKRYPGSESPSWFESNVQLLDADRQIDLEKRIFMNHTLKHRGYRFYQSSYDTDEAGTVLSINHDGAGTAITYTGYFLMALGMMLSLFNRNSRFRKLALEKTTVSKQVKSLMIGLVLLSQSSLFAQNVHSIPVIPEQKARDFGTILVQNNGGRIEPVSTLASELLRKLARIEEYKEQNPEQVLIGMIAFPEYWQHEPMIRVNHPEIKKILGTESNFVSFVDFFASGRYGGYTLRSYVEEAYRKKPAYRSKMDNELIRVDERLNVAYLVYSGAVFRIFPDPEDSSHLWHSPLSAPSVFTGKDSIFSSHILAYYAEEVQKSVKSGIWQEPDALIIAIKNFQTEYGKKVLPPDSRIKAEIIYNKSRLYLRIMRIYLLLGLVLLLIQFVHIFLPRFSIRTINRTALILILLTFLAHTSALGMRWYIAGHAPWSNGYEALTFIAWASVLAGMIFSGRSGITLSTTAVLAALILQTAHLSLMDPRITNLVPVLQSYWLIIHVAVITSSYGFLGLGALLAGVNLLLLCLQNNRNYQRLDEIINQLTRVIEMTLIAGLYMLTVGSFLGAIWANESWGRYWAWDPKETWALVTVIVYAFILHLRLVPGMRGRVMFNILALIGFSSVLMTYFGVNYYLSGLHSYAQGDPLPVPPAVYYSAAVVSVLSMLAAINQSHLLKRRTD
jgi:cytochrome c-type biogenesis protein CcsB